MGKEHRFVSLDGKSYVPGRDFVTRSRDEKPQEKTREWTGGYPVRRRNHLSDLPLVALPTAEDLPDAPLAA